MAKKKTDAFRHNFLADCKIYLACASDKFRPIMECVYFEDGFAYATDTHIALRAPMCDISSFEPEEIEKLNGHCIHKDDFKEILRYPVIDYIGEDGIGVVGFGNRTFKAKYTEGKYPKIKEIFKQELPQDGVRTVGINAKFLDRLAKAMGVSVCLKMEFVDQYKPIFVRPINAAGNDITGIIMPIMVTEE